VGRKLFVDATFKASDDKLVVAETACQSTVLHPVSDVDCSRSDKSVSTSFIISSKDSLLSLLANIFGCRICILGRLTEAMERNACDDCITMANRTIHRFAIPSPFFDIGTAPDEALNRDLHERVSEAS
jgi:hypothetical protein